ncbi:hypothetical protein AgCh_026555 [Apium graveolens]
MLNIGSKKGQLGDWIIKYVRKYRGDRPTNREGLGRPREKEEKERSDNVKLVMLGNAKWVHHPHNDALVVKVCIGAMNFYRVFIDNDAENTKQKENMLAANYGPLTSVGISNSTLDQNNEIYEPDMKEDNNNQQNGDCFAVLSSDKTKMTTDKKMEQILPPLLFLKIACFTSMDDSREIEVNSVFSVLQV